MAWELAIVAGILGTAFFFVYLANSISGTNWIQEGMKMALILVALLLMITNATLPIHFISYADSGANTSYNFTTMTNLATTNLKTTTTIVVLIIFLLLVWLLWSVIHLMLGGNERWG